MATFYIDEFVKVTHKVEAETKEEAMKLLREDDMFSYAVEFDTQEYYIEENEDA